MSISFTGIKSFKSIALGALCMHLKTEVVCNWQVWAYVIFILLLVLTSDRFYVLIFHAGGVWILIEVAAGYLVARVLLEAIVGKKFIFGGTGDMIHPVFWTW